MHQDLQDFQKLYNTKKILMTNESLNKIIQKFQFFVIQQNNQPEIEKEKQAIKERKNESKIIIIDQLRRPYEEYLSIIFDKTIIIVSKTDQFFLISLLNQHNESTIFTVSNKIISILPTEIQLKFYKYEEPFKKEYLNIIDKFSENFILKTPKEVKFKKIWKLIEPILSSYFINKSYTILRLERQSIYDKEMQKIHLNENNYITLQYMGTSNVELIFHCEKEQLFVLKKFMEFTDEKLFKRELNNYQKNLNHPNLPIFYGTANINGIDCLIIEYIKGYSLLKIDELKLTETDKLDIIFQLILTIEFLQSKTLIYRDLKPSNLIIDDHRNLILIDFDRMIGIGEQENAEIRTKNFSNPYMAPELLNENFENYTYEEDIYSIGLLIYYIITQQNPIRGREDKSNNDNYTFNNFTPTYECLKKLCEECTESDPYQRPKITKIIDYFYNNLISQNIIQRKSYITSNINKTIFYPYWKCKEHHFLIRFVKGYKNEIKEKYSQETNNIHLFNQFKLGLEYYPERYFQENISSFISCLSSISDENQSQSQFYLGYIYYRNKYVLPDANKSIYYLTLSSDQNNLDAQFYLGKIYYEGELIPRDINKSIHYFLLSSNQNNSHAQFYLGIIYYEGKYVQRDINKSIYYLTVSSKNNDSDAQFFLGKIYYEGKYVQRDTNKSIHYLTISSNKNDRFVQFYLGLIYYEGKYIPRDINKSIHFFLLSANQNNSNSQYYLGVIYYEGKYVTRDINNSIHFLLLSANQNNKNAQYYLGVIYYEGKYIPRDINKSIQYFLLSSKQNNPVALYYLAFIYHKGEYVSCDIKKAIHYYSLAASQNYSPAQYNLGFIYIDGEIIEKNVIKGIDYMIQSSKNGCKKAHFIVGFFYHEGKYIQQDIFKAIQYYKEASNVNDKNAKNNLGIIYKNGFLNKISRNIQLSIEYFKESIQLDETSVSLYNLSHIYLYNYKNNEMFDEATELLISSISTHESFLPSYYLLTLALIKKYEFKIENIKQFFDEKTPKLNKLQKIINQIVYDEELYDEKNYNIIYEYYKNIDFLYDFNVDILESRNINKQKTNKNNKIKPRYNLNRDFYEGFYGEL